MKDLLGRGLLVLVRADLTQLQANTQSRQLGMKHGSNAPVNTTNTAK
jgi:hypothetical protein